MAFDALANEPLVSILLCNYNYGSMLAAAIDSALGQSYSNLEVIVVDDGSTDNSREVMAGYGDRVKTILKENGGQSTAFNAAFAASSGEIICLLDSDDYFLPDKVRKIVSCYQAHEGAQYVFHALKRIGINGVDVESVARNADTLWEPKESSRWLDYRHRRNTFTAPPTTGITLRRTLWKKLGVIPREVEALMDNYVKFVVMGLSKGYYLAEELAVLTLHGRNRFSMGGHAISRLPVDVSIASAMRRNFPELLPQADRHAAITLAKWWRLKGSYDLDETSKALDAYLSEASWISKARVYAGGWLRYWKHSATAGSKEHAYRFP